MKYLRWHSLEDLIAIPLVGLMAGFIVPWLGLSSINVYLDTSQPRYEVFEITDMYISSGAKQITTYNVKVENDNKQFTIAISKYKYTTVEIGDEITLSVHQGAFNEAYYIHEEEYT